MTWLKAPIPSKISVTFGESDMMRLGMSRFDLGDSGSDGVNEESLQTSIQELVAKTRPSQILDRERSLPKKVGHKEQRDFCLVSFRDGSFSAKTRFASNVAGTSILSKKNSS